MAENRNYSGIDNISSTSKNDDTAYQSLGDVMTAKRENIHQKTLNLILKGTERRRS